MPRVGGGRGAPSADWDAGAVAPRSMEQLGSSSLFAKYINASQDLASDDILSDQVFNRGLERVQEYLGSSNEDGGACLICLCQIRPNDAVWDCSGGCYAVMHLNCVEDWARSQLDAAKARAASSPAPAPGTPLAPQGKGTAAAEWACPKCRQAYGASAIPSVYSCFCRKQVDPEWDPWVTPHTCGELCGKALSGDCGHTCLLLCHPGPCPPCPLVVDAPCHCGRMKRKRRCGHNEYSCGSVCGVKLECGHTCPDTCHEGECAPCRQVGLFRCACSAEERRLECGQRTFHCARVCGRPLACSHHSCDKACHAGVCGACAYEGTRACPCGKAEHPELSCTDKVPTCSETCGKLLACGVHKCAERCHYGACPQTCKSLVIKSCRCGKMQKEVLCHTELMCERRCNNLRACGRHACKRRCCDDGCLPCEEVCGRKLRCGNHKCQSPCHSGPCRPCPLTLLVTCACGTARSTIPCGAEKWAMPPRCSADCEVPALCRHAAQRPAHCCHYGACPPCAEPCGMVLACGHACPSDRCHDAPAPAVPQFERPVAPAASALLRLLRAAADGEDLQRQGSGAVAVASGGDGKRGKVAAATAAATATAPPAATRAVREALQSGGAQSECPPCTAAVPVVCMGGHTQISTQCHRVAAFSCGAPCSRLLACGNHACELACHATGEFGPPAPAVPCAACTWLCSRPSQCTHGCKRPCHPGECVPCDMPMHVACYCGRANVPLLCHELGALDGRLCCGKPCHRPLPRCPHPCRELCHPGACPGQDGCQEEVTVRCACKRLKAKWRCQAVLEALTAAAAGGGAAGPSSYDSTAAPRVLPCDEECKAGRAEPTVAAAKDPCADRAAKTVSSMPAAATKQKQMAAAAAAPKLRLNKAEREALAAVEADRKEAQRLRVRRMQIALQVLAWVLIAAVGIALGVWGQALDSKMRTWWSLR